MCKAPATHAIIRRRRRRCRGRQGCVERLLVHGAAERRLGGHDLLQGVGAEGVLQHLLEDRSVERVTLRHLPDEVERLLRDFAPAGVVEGESVLIVRRRSSSGSEVWKGSSRKA